ncbi:hypothetical protein [Curvibacter delicatus]|uniref:hypothetical protein n=1 Tax=Curvibacter delicatus TaxID=80879 RepID=UPI000836302F|nr:hypothetical protein [Curvibacter delicatus]
MPATISQWATTPDEKAAWEELDAAESRLEQHLLKSDGQIAKVGGWGYYIGRDGRMLCAPLMVDESLDLETSFHRSEHEGLSAQDMRDIAGNVRAWLQNSQVTAATAA